MRHATSHPLRQLPWPLCGYDVASTAISFCPIMHAPSASCIMGIHSKLGEKRMGEKKWMRVDLQRVRGRNGHAGGQPTPVIYSYWLLTTPFLVVPSWLCRVAEDVSNAVTFPIPPILANLFLLLVHTWQFACQPCHKLGLPRRGLRFL